MTRCDGCGHCVDICPSEACPHNAIDVRGYADFAPLGHSVRVIRDEEKGVIAWRIKSRNGETDMNLLAPITTKPWGTAIPQLREAAAPSQEMRDSQLLFNEPKYIRMDEGDIHTLESNGLKMKAGVAY
jgi:adenylylsulfate reductase subunit B